jgi:pimeloyl-ACP methyl ester carboxylesterase
MTDTERIEPEPFPIQIGQTVLDDLQLRLKRTRWPSAKDTDWSFGTDTGYLRDLITYWQASYDWRAHEAQLNGLSPYRARVDGKSIFFVRERGRGPRPTPLLLLHGWPDSFYRFHKVIDMFANPPAGGRELTDSFDVVVPSQPGFAFTELKPATERPIAHGAEQLWKLMTQVLGYDRFIVAGGDGGSALAQCMAIAHPESVLGIHVTDLGWHVFNMDPDSLSKAERKHMKASRKQSQADGAYALVQMSGPRSLAGLNDSPAGLAAWITDRFHSWVDFDADLERVVTRDELLTNIMLYWATQTIGSSVIGYHYEAQHPSLTPKDRVERPVAVALFPKDIGGIPPRSLAERTLNVQRWTEMPRGGHFTALEQPELYARDLFAFSRELRGLRSKPEPEAGHVVPIF